MKPPDEEENGGNDECNDGRVHRGGTRVETRASWLTYRSWQGTANGAGSEDRCVLQPEDERRAKPLQARDLDGGVPCRDAK